MIPETKNHRLCDATEKLRQCNLKYFKAFLLKHGRLQRLLRGEQLTNLHKFEYGSTRNQDGNIFGARFPVADGLTEMLNFEIEQDQTIEQITMI